MDEHQLNNIFAALDMQVGALEKMFPSLLKAYRLATEQHLLEQNLNPKQLQLLEELVSELRPELARLKECIQK